MKLDEQAYLDLLTDLQGRGFGGSLADMTGALKRQAFRTQLRLLGAQVENFYGVRQEPAKQFFHRCLVLAGARFCHIRGDGPAFDESSFIVSRVLSPTEAAAGTVRVTWLHVRIEEIAGGLVVFIRLHGKQGILLREREYRFGAVNRPA